jgi:hypothetical protein
MLIPAFLFLGRGVGALASVWATNRQMFGSRPEAGAVPPRRQTGELPAPPPEYTLPPASVTENTTRQLDPNKERFSQGR